MQKEVEAVKQAKESFERILGNPQYSAIIRDDQHLSLLLSLTEGGSVHRILDIGTGSGYLAFALAQKYREARVCGIDIAEKAIAENNQRAVEKGVSNLSFRSFDGLTYPFEDQSFDLIVSRYAFHHFPDAADAVRQMNRLLIQGGKVLIADPMSNGQDDHRVIDEFMRVKQDGHNRFYASAELEELFAGYGFAVQKRAITGMRFPFPKKQEYLALYAKTTEQEKQLYEMTDQSGVIWVQHIEIGNTVFVKTAEA